jgi:ATP/maltotriose-dependent transcriptional regulator MalT
MVPSPAALLHRPGVCETIDGGLNCKLTLVSAPAGYGKTSALVDFARHTSVPTCWYTVDERDRNLGTFVAYLVGAIAEQFDGFGQATLQALEASAGDFFGDAPAIAGQLANELVEIDDPFALVVDGFEAVSGAFGLREFMGRLLEVLPTRCHLMLGSRELPGVPVTRLVAKRQLMGLTAEDLAFTPSEVRNLLRMSEIEVTEARAKSLVEDSQGWITGLLLLADVLRAGDSAAMRALGDVSADTYKYLAEDVLTLQPPDIQHFLTTSAVLREMSYRLCQEALQIGQPAPLLAEVERRNLFVTRFGPSGAATYRYHDLFREFLRDWLHQHNPVLYAELHRRAATWFDQTNDVDEAVWHYLAARAYSEATVRMERVAREWFTRGRAETLLSWANSLPRDEKLRAPWLLFYQSRVMADHNDYDGARRALSYAEKGFVSQRNTAHIARVHNQRATIAMFEGRYEDVVSDALAALDMLGHDEVLEWAESHRLIGRAYIGLGRIDEGVAKLNSALSLFKHVGSPYDTVNVLQDLTLAWTSQGRIDEAISCMHEALIIARRLGAHTQLAGVLNNLGTLHSMRGEYVEAVALYEEGLSAARRGDDPRWQAYTLVGMADAYRDIGAYERAQGLYRAAWPFVRNSEPRLAVLALTAQADAYRWEGNTAQAMALAGAAHSLAKEKGLEFEAKGIAPLSQGAALFESGDIAGGIQLLSGCVSFLEARGEKQELARASFLLARAFLANGDRAQALANLSRALSIASEIGTDHFAVTEGRHADGLVELGIAEGVEGCELLAEKIEHLTSLAAQMNQTSEETRSGSPRRLEVAALGEGRVVRDGKPVTSSDWQAAMSKELFFFILMNGPVSRDAIGLEFWPDLSVKKMRNAFHSTLYRVRRAIGPNGVVVEDGLYRVGDVDLQFDVVEFKDAVDRARLLPNRDAQAELLWRRAVSLYGGDLLPEAERLWCLTERESLRTMYLEALLGLARRCEERGEFAEAISWYERVLAADELAEDTYRRLMQCYVQSGQRTKALEQYHRCQEVLDRELGVEPSEETEHLYREIFGPLPLSA